VPTRGGKGGGVMKKRSLSEGFLAVLPPVLGVDFLEVISSRPNVVERSSGGILASIVVLFPQQHSLDVLLARHDLHARQPVHEIQLLLDLGGIALDGHGVEGRSKSGTVSEHGDGLALQVGRIDAREERSETAVQRSGVHVAATFRAPHRRLDALGVFGLSGTDEGLLDGLVGQGSLVFDFEDIIGGDVDELGVLWVGDEIVVEESTVTFLDHLSVGGVEDGVVYRVEGEVNTLLGDFGAVAFIGAVESPDVGGDGEWSVDLGVLGVKPGFVEIVGVGHVVSVDSWRLFERGNQQTRQQVKREAEC